MGFCVGAPNLPKSKSCCCNHVLDIPRSWIHSCMAGWNIRVEPLGCSTVGTPLEASKACSSLPRWKEVKWSTSCKSMQQKLRQHKFHFEFSNYIHTHRPCKLTEKSRHGCHCKPTPFTHMLQRWPSHRKCHASSMRATVDPTERFAHNPKMCKTTSY